MYPYLHEALWTSDARAQLGSHDPFESTRRLVGPTAHLDTVSRLQYLDTLQYLPADILTKVDRMSMAHSLEVRSPLLDHTLVEYAATLPVSLKLRGTVGKYVLRRVAARLLPPEVLTKPKQGFAIPKDRWFRGELRSFAEDVLLDRRSLWRGYLRKDTLTRMLHHHATGRRDYSTWIWCLIVLELWSRRYLDGTSVEQRAMMIAPPRTDPAPSAPGSRLFAADSLTGGALWLMAGKTVSFVFALALPLLLVRRLSQTDFGLYKQVFLLVGSAITMLPLGFVMSAFYFLPRQPGRRSRVAFNILLFHAAVAGVAALALLARPSILESIFHDPSLTTLAGPIACVLFLMVATSFLELLALANGDVRAATLLIVISNLTKTVLLLGAAFVFASVQALVWAAALQGLCRRDSCSGTFTPASRASGAAVTARSCAPRPCTWCRSARWPSSRWSRAICTSTSWRTTSTRPPTRSTPSDASSFPSCRSSANRSAP